MSATLRGMRNAFRRPGRTLAVTAVIGLAVGLALSMAAARQAVGHEVDDVKANAGTLLDVYPSREDMFLRGSGVAISFGPGGPADAPTLDETDLVPLRDLDHVRGLSLDLDGQLQGNDTSLKPPFDPPTGLPPGVVLRMPQLSYGTTDPSRVPIQGGGAMVIAIPAGGPGGPGPGAEPVAEMPDPADSFRITAGRAFDGWGNAREALIGQRVAEKNGLQVGDTFTIHGQAITVVGIFDVGDDFAATAILLPLHTMQELTNRTGAVSQASVRVDSLDNVAKVQAEAQAMLGEDTDVVPRDESAAAALTPLRGIQDLAGASLAVAALVAGAVIALTMAVIVRERQREIGVVKALGAAPRHILAQFAAESATLAALGAVVGLAIALVGHDAMLDVLARQNGAGSDLDAVVPPWLLVVAAAGALALGLVGALVPAGLVSRIRPSVVLRGA